MFQEADIVINGRRLSVGQSMTIRVAIEAFASDLALNGLGDDENGKKICSLYQANIGKIREFIMQER